MGGVIAAGGAIVSSLCCVLPSGVVLLGLGTLSIRAAWGKVFPG